MRRPAALLAASLAFAPAVARAQAPQTPRAPAPPPTATRTSKGDEEPTAAPATRRSGFVAGITGGFLLGTASGYPNESSKIGDPAYYAAGGNMFGGTGALFIEAALADVFSVGIWGGSGLLQNGDWSSMSTAFGFRVEAFPLFYVAPWLRDLGFMAAFGIGQAQLEASRGPYPGASGVQSFLGVGAFYEWNVLRGKHVHLALGPDVEYNYVGARSIDRHALVLGARVVFYSGP